MEGPTKLRESCTQAIQIVWDAIISVRQQRQVPNLNRINNYIRRKSSTVADPFHEDPINLSFKTKDDVEIQLEYALRDGLIRVLKSVANKGAKVGAEQQAYRLPEGEVERADHDWYCFECHRAGEVLLCSSCYRVYHNECIKDNEDKQPFVCAVCKMCNAPNNYNIRPKDLNRLMIFTSDRLKEKTRDLHAMPHPDEEVWRHEYLLYQPMDLNTMEERAQTRFYTRMEEFQVDAQTIVHNVVIVYGVHSTMADMARQMLRDCIYDLGEIRQCRDCYRTSNEKRDKFWFCQPCNPPHDLVYAKQKGFPYWPAKVIRKFNAAYDVRFFGAQHQRANVEEEYIKPITSSEKSIQAKHTISWNKATEELRRHQELLQKWKREGRFVKEPHSDDDSSGTSSSRSGSPEPPPVSRQAAVASPLPVPPIPPPTTQKKRPRSKLEEDVKPEVESKPPPSLVKKKARSKQLGVGGGAGASTAETASSQDESISSSSRPKKKVKHSPPEDHNVVSSSSSEPSGTKSVAVQTVRKSSNSNKGTQTESSSDNLEASDRSAKDLIEKMKKESRADKDRMMKEIAVKMEEEIEMAKKEVEEKCNADHQQEILMLGERHRQTISDIKKKQWCFNCEAEAIYHCCWNTSYCSIECQQVHWHKEHKRSCRRKRQ